MPRVFVYDGREFDDPDPDPTASVEEVRHYLTHFYGDHEGWRAGRRSRTAPNCSRVRWKDRGASLVLPPWF